MIIATCIILAFPVIICGYAYFKPRKVIVA